MRAVIMASSNTIKIEVITAVRARATAHGDNPIASPYSMKDDFSSYYLRIISLQAM